MVLWGRHAIAAWADRKGFPRLRIEIVLSDTLGWAVLACECPFDAIIVIQPQFFGAMKRHGLLARRSDFGRDLATDVGRSIVLAAIRWRQAISDGADHVNASRALETRPRPRPLPWHVPGRSGFHGGRRHQHGEDRPRITAIPISDHR